MMPGQTPVPARIIEVSAKGLRLEVNFHPPVGSSAMVKVDINYANRRIAFICALEFRHVIAKGVSFQCGAMITRIDSKPAEFLSNYAMDFV